MEVAIDKYIMVFLWLYAIIVGSAVVGVGYRVFQKGCDQS